jgi:NTE family protein
MTRRALSAKRKKPRVAIVLGGGGARGLAHIPMLEALDEMGIVPTAIAGTSIGAIVGAVYAAGLSGERIRAHTLSMFRNRTRVFAKLFEARIGRMADLFARGNPVLLDGESLLDRFWPQEVPDDFEELTIPFTAVATDYYGCSQIAFSSGALVSAVAASMALPGLIKPVDIEGKLLIDGGAVNPLPCDVVAGKADIIVAVDVTGTPAADEAGLPNAISTLFGAAQIMQAAIAKVKTTAHPPDILVRPAIQQFGVIDFFKASRILEAAAPAKAKLKEELAEKLAKA